MRSICLLLSIPSPMRWNRYGRLGASFDHSTISKLCRLGQISHDTKIEIDLMPKKVGLSAMKTNIDLKRGSNRRNRNQRCGRPTK